MLTVPNTMELGKMIFSTAEESKHGRTTVDMRVTISMDANMALVFTLGVMVASMLAIGTTTRYKVLESISGQTVAVLKENGRKTTCKVLAYIIGLTVARIKVGTITIKNTGMESTSGLMAAATKATGIEANNTD